MDNSSFASISPDGRFKIVHSAPQSRGDHFCPETNLDWTRPETIQSVRFSIDRKEVLAKNRKGKIIERVILVEF